MSPQRVQRKRTKGYRLPEGAVYVGRPTVFGNPYRVGDWWLGQQMTRRDTARRYSLTLALGLSPEFARALEDLRKCDLVCWCPLDQPCHADVLLELVNR